MILGEIDLSIGAMYVFAPFVFYKFDTAGLGLVPSLILALLVCMAVGLINGFFVAVVGIASFVVDAGNAVRLRGASPDHLPREPVTTPGSEVHVVNGVNHISTFAKIFGGGTYSELIWALVIVVLLQVVLTFTRWGLYTVAIGSNKLGAAEAGVRVRARDDPQLHPVCADGGLRRHPRGGALEHDPPGTSAANEILFLAIAAAVIGGTLLAGGSGTVVGALIGALFLGILNDGLILQGVNANYLLFYTASRSSWR